MENSIIATEPMVAEQLQQQIILQKRTAWAEMGEVIYKSELQLNLEAQNILMNVCLPTKIEDIPMAETLLKDIKASQKTIEAKRKEITSKFDAVGQRLMVAEKSFADPIKQLSDAIIAIKKTFEAEQAKLAQKANELKAIRDFYLNKNIEVDAQLKSKVNNLVNRCYEKALNENIEVAKIDTYIQSSKDAITDTVFKVEHPNFTPAYNSIEDTFAIFKQVYSINPANYVVEFAKELDKKFNDYNIAFENKAQALANSQKESLEKQQLLDQQKLQQEMAVKIESASTEIVTIAPDFKALRKSYEVEMPETVESVLQIMGAFSANIHLCLPKLKVNKWFAFTPAQASNVLGKVKCDDNNFQPQGIIFKEVSKL